MFRIEPNTPVELKRGVLAFAAPDEPCDEDRPRARPRSCFAPARAPWSTVPEPLMRVAGATRRRRARPTGRSLVEAQVDAAVRRGMPAALAAHARDGDDGRLGRAAAGARRTTRCAVRRAVASPGGTTARGLAALERGGVRSAFAQAMDDVVD